MPDMNGSSQETSTGTCPECGKPMSEAVPRDTCYLNSQHGMAYRNKRMADLVMSKFRLSDETAKDVRQTVEDKLKSGWSGYDIERYVMCMEEVYPYLPEALALKRMKAITIKFRKEE